jgi:hypothetical protein
MKRQTIKERQAQRFNQVNNPDKNKRNYTGVFYGVILKSFMEKRCKLPNGIASK